MTSNANGENAKAEAKDADSTSNRDEKDNATTKRRKTNITMLETKSNVSGKSKSTPPTNMSFKVLAKPSIVLFH
eukprot:CAMPEP_0172323414 /NCGR_PEP_ID=MMETSP1058-20130122/48677_1 /TAXON_ID=83371 /ORGANISM="Detonula confervacea, Strain CCMP 353" /LENGTH=73 /DNA_ID=CAMNT_0013039397 /DNA_START=1 /DNA_END=219 /DNA_ORIENTATION=+